MSDDKWARASVLVFVTDPSPSVTTVLGGLLDVHQSPRAGHWIARTDLDSNAPMEAHIAAAVDALEASADAVATWQQQGEVELGLGFGSENGQGGFVTEPSVLARLAALGITVTLDLYPPSGEAA